MSGMYRAIGIDRRGRDFVLRFAASVDGLTPALIAEGASMHMLCVPTDCRAVYLQRWEALSPSMGRWRYHDVLDVGAVRRAFSRRLRSLRDVD